MNQTEVNATIQKKHWWQHDKVKLLSVLAFIAAVVSFVSTLFVTAQTNSDVILFPVYRLFSTVGTIICAASCLIVPLMLISVGYFVFENMVNPKDYPEVYFFELLLLLLSGALLLFALINAGSNSWLIAIGHDRLSDRAYYLAERHRFDEFSLVGFELYECPAPGIICSLIHKTGYVGSGGQAQLLIMPDTNAVTLVVNGESVFSITR
jgi:hypothetical protein